MTPLHIPASQGTQGTSITLTHNLVNRSTAHVVIPSDNALLAFDLLASQLEDFAEMLAAVEVPGVTQVDTTVATL